MKYIAEIDIMPQKEILDPQGKAVKLGLHNLHIDSVATFGLVNTFGWKLRLSRKKRRKPLSTPPAASYSPT
jgi:phosphoribosylformylglycinamidine (FGAM) synthase PurS component